MFGRFFSESDDRGISITKLGSDYNEDAKKIFYFILLKELTVQDFLKPSA
jgi:hypothetical protein